MCSKSAWQVIVWYTLKEEDRIVQIFYLSSNSLMRQSANKIGIRYQVLMTITHSTKSLRQLTLGRSQKWLCSIPPHSSKRSSLHWESKNLDTIFTPEPHLFWSLSSFMCSCSSALSLCHNSILSLLRAGLQVNQKFSSPKWPFSWCSFSLWLF